MLSVVIFNDRVKSFYHIRLHVLGTDMRVCLPLYLYYVGKALGV